MSDDRPFTSRVKQLIDSTDQQKVNQLYAEWSQTYNEDLESYGYVAPKIATELFTNTVADKDALILDAGCGTGLVGAILGAYGYQQFHGSDFSEEMLDHARKINQYERLQLSDFSKPLSIESGIYDAIISVGVYSSRLKETYIPEMLRILKPGGHFLFTCREQFFEEVTLTIKDLHERSIINEATFRHEDYMTGQQARAYYIKLQRAEID